MATFDYLVFIGRFEPFHNGHRYVLERALAQARKVIVIVGSAGRPRTTKNPWNAEERAVMIRHSIPTSVEGGADRVLIRAVSDFADNDELWSRAIQDQVKRALTEAGDDPVSVRVGLIGHDKDASSYYLRMFPQWKRVEAQSVAMSLSATHVRDAFLDRANEAGNLMLVESAVPPPVFEFLKSFRATPAFAALAKEYDFLRAYREGWSSAPYPPTFVTVDAVVAHSGHVLLVRRRSEPGKGLWAWPGGFLRGSERLLDACLREVREETRLKLPAPVLRGSLKAQRVFDAPDRSLRGRTITHAFFFEFTTGDLPEVRGKDDADKAEWIPLTDFFAMRELMFEDHFDIGVHFLGGV